jgi:hypothetical protein
MNELFEQIYTLSNEDDKLEETVNDYSTETETSVLEDRMSKLFESIYSECKQEKQSE